MTRRTQAMYDLLASAHLSGKEPWGTMYTQGHGDHWRAAAEYVKRNQNLWVGALSFDGEAISPH